MILDLVIGRDKPARQRALEAAVLVAVLVGTAIAAQELGGWDELAWLLYGAGLGIAREAFGAGRTVLRSSWPPAATDAPKPDPDTVDTIPPPPPPAPRRPPTFPVLLLALPLTVSLEACGASALEMQAHAAARAQVAVHQARERVSAGYRSAGLACVDEYDAEAEALTCELQASLDWSPAIAAVDASTDALAAWVAALLVASHGADLNPEEIVGLLQQLVRSYHSAAELGRRLGLKLPALPELLP